MSPEQWRVLTDRGRGSIILLTGESAHGLPVDVTVELAESSGAGDQTVPSRSAAVQLKSGKFKGIFEQRGYEHQFSYQHPSALSSTVYSITRIVQSMKWD
jgi:hypothetical protein